MITAPPLRQKWCSCFLLSHMLSGRVVWSGSGLVDPKVWTALCPPPPYSNSCAKSNTVWYSLRVHPYTAGLSTIWPVFFFSHKYLKQRQSHAGIWFDLLRQWKMTLWEAWMFLFRGTLIVWANDSFPEHSNTIYVFMDRAFIAALLYWKHSQNGKERDYEPLIQWARKLESLIERLSEVVKDWSLHVSLLDFWLLHLPILV